MLDFECKSLQKVSLFRDIDARSLQLIAFAANRVSFQANEVVFERGSESDAMYIVVEGEVQTFINAPDGHEMLLSTFGPGRSFGDINILNNSDRFMTVRAKSQCTLLHISRSDFLELTREVQPFAHAVMKDLARRLELMIQHYAAQPPA